MIHGENGEWPGEQFDYRQIKAGGEVTEQDLLALLGQVGVEGWELCSTLMVEGMPLLIFKRRHLAMVQSSPRLLGRV